MKTKDSPHDKGGKWLHDRSKEPTIWIHMLQITPDRGQPTPGLRACIQIECYAAIRLYQLSDDSICICRNFSWMYTPHESYRGKARTGWGGENREKKVLVLAGNPCEGSFLHNGLVWLQLCEGNASCG
jgi:hypothetical protein